MRSPVIITVMWDLAGAPVASITVTSEMARIFSEGLGGGHGKARAIKNKAGAKTVFIVGYASSAHFVDFAANN
jgi:hypothetical protein